MSTAQQITAYLIDPEEKAITQVEYGGDYRQIYQYIGGDCFGSAYFNNAGDHVYYRDDPAVFRECHSFFSIIGYASRLCGKGLVMGQNGSKEGTPTVDITWLRNNVVF